MHSVLHREHTIAEGGGICDYWTVGDQIATPPIDKEDTEWGLGHLTKISPIQIAELGCGGGRNAGELLKKYPAAKVTAIDYSPLSVKEATEYNKQEIDAGRCQVLQGDVSALTLEENSYDLTTAFETIYF